MLSRRCQPPERTLARRLASPSSPSSARTRLRRARGSPAPQTPALSSRFSSTVRLGATAVSWGETPILRFTARGGG